MSSGMEYLLEGEGRANWRSFFSVVVRWIAFMLAVGLMQSWDATWLPALIGPVAFLYLRGERYEAYIDGDATNRTVAFRPWGNGFGAFATGAVAVGAFISNIAWPGLPGLVLWGLVLLLVADKWRGWSASYGETPASVGTVLLAMGACQWISPWLLWLVVGLIVGGYLIGKALDGGSPESLTVVASSALVNWCDRFGVLSASLVGLFAVGINVAFPSTVSALAWLVFGGFVISRWLGDRAVGLSKSKKEPAPASEVTPEMAAAARFGQHVLHQAGLTVKSPATGLPMPPDVGPIQFDALGRPQFAARMIPGHQTMDTWVTAADRIASAWGVLRVIVEQGLDRQTQQPIPGVVLVTGIAREFVRNGPVQWTPNHLKLSAGVSVVEYLSSLPMGEMAESDQPWFMSLVEANLVIGGIPGSGKSVFENAIVAHLAAHPHIEIAYIDLKRGVESRPWAARLSARTKTVEESAALIEWMLNECDARYDRMEEQGVKNAWKDGFLGEKEPVRVLVIDEASRLFKEGTKEARALTAKITDDLVSLVAIGRAAGYVVILATQKPTAKSVPTDVRDNCSLKVAFRCEVNVAAYAILGDSFNPTNEECNPIKITESQRGQAVTASETGHLQRVQSSLIDDETIGRMALSPWSGYQWPFMSQGTASGETSAPDMRKGPASTDTPPLVSGLDALADDDEPRPWKPTTPPPPLPSLNKTENEKKEEA